MWFSGFFFLILSIIVEVYLWWKLQASLIFLSGRTCTIGGWLNTFLPHCICNVYLCSYFFYKKDKIMTFVIFAPFGLNICRSFFVTLKGFIIGKLVWLYCSDNLQNSKTNMTKNRDKIMNRDISKRKIMISYFFHIAHPSIDSLYHYIHQKVNLIHCVYCICQFWCLVILFNIETPLKQLICIAVISTFSNL